jgi:hypothetical protein
MLGESTKTRLRATARPRPAKVEMKDLAEMTVGELSEYLSKLQVDLEDLEEERMFVLGQTGLHVSAGEVKKYEAEFDSLKARIEEAERLVRAKQTP